MLHAPGAAKLHFLVSAAIMGCIQQLKNIIPDVLDHLGCRFLTFDQVKFELINSDIRDLDKHKTAINFFSGPLMWHDTINDLLLVSQYQEKQKEELLTNLFQLQPFISIHAIKNNQ